MKNTKTADLFSKFSVKTICIFSLLCVFSLTSLSLFVLPRLQTQYSLKQFLPENSHLLENDEHTRKLFQLPESQPFIVTAKLKQEDEIWFQSSKIQALERLTELVASFHEVNSTLSLATIQGAVAEGEGLSVGPLLKSLPERRWASETLKNPLISPTLLSQDGRTT